MCNIKFINVGKFLKNWLLINNNKYLGYKWWKAKHVYWIFSVFKETVAEKRRISSAELPEAASSAGCTPSRSCLLRQVFLTFGMPYVHFCGWLVEYSCLNMCPNERTKTADSTGSTDSVLVSNTQSSEHQKFSTKVISVQLYVSKGLNAPILNAPGNHLHFSATVSLKIEKIQ